jgi:iron complex outermembrane receptor protein
MLLFYSAHAQPQTDTLKEVNVKGQRLNKSNDERVRTFSPGQKTLSIDSTILKQYQFQSLANLISQQVPVFVRSYGVNNMATLNFRGSSAAQTQLYWNGIPIQNAALGIADITLIPVSFANKINILYGSSSALWGSGNVGGAVLIENDLPVYNPDKKFLHEVSGAAGSFGQYQLGLKTAYAGKRLSACVQALGQQATNDFTYSDAGVSKRMANSQLQSGSVMGQVGYRIDDQQSIRIIGWYQNYNREIPRALFESFSVKNQLDRSVRLLGEWKRGSEKANVYARLAYLQDRMKYEDSAIKLYSDNTTQQVYAEEGITYKFHPRHSMMLFVPVHLSWLKNQNNNYNQTRAAIAGAYSYKSLNGRLNAGLSLREEFVNQFTILLPGVSGSYLLTNWLSVRGNVQRSFRAPTLNELYYQPGGNPALKPEQGWNAEAGYNLNLSNNAWNLQHSMSYFDRTINDWILWFGGSIWTPHNIATVHSRGVEAENKLFYKAGDWLFNLGLNTSYIVATTQKSYVSNDGSIGKQIPYSPRYIGQGNVGVGYKKLSLNYVHTYTGYRFVTIDESQYLTPYHTGNLHASYQFMVKKSDFSLIGQWNNVWNETYFVVNSRPMPLSNWQVGFVCRF